MRSTEGKEKRDLTSRAEMEVEEGWETPKRREYRIPAVFPCPPPPRKKPTVALAKRRDPPKNGYFQPPDLEALFALPLRREASCA